MWRKPSLKTVVFFWMLLSVTIPLVSLLVVATRYSQKYYQQEVRQDITHALNRAVAAYDRRIFIERDLITGLGQSPAVREYIALLNAIKLGADNPKFDWRAERLAQFLEAFQGVRRSLGTVRVLDHRGDTLLKVENGRRQNAGEEGQEAAPVVERGSANAQFRADLAGLRPADVGSLLSLSDLFDSEAVFNTVLPLRHDKEVVGYLVTEAPLAPLDQTLDMVSRPREASLIVAEINPEDPKRHGMILYSDEDGSLLRENGQRRYLAQQMPRLAEAVSFGSEGELRESDGSAYYYLHYMPYPDRLLSWAFIFRVKAEHLETPFQHVRYLIWVGVLIALLIALLVTHLGVHQVTRPIQALTQRLTTFTAGERRGRLQPVGPREMWEACDSFNHMADTLQQAELERDEAQRAMVQSAKLASVGQLAAGIGHELSNPLGNIYSLTKLVQRRLPEEEPARMDIDLIREEAERASMIIKGLLNFARQGETDPSRFDLAQWLSESVTLVERLARNRDVEIAFPRQEQGQLYGDRGLLQQALVNILVNAIQAAPRGSEVTVSVQPGEDQVVIGVLDRGDGIAPGAEERLFDPFFTTKPEGEGTGLGLSIAMGVVTRHGGRLTLANAPGGGALALLHIPRTTAVSGLEDGADG